ncbi:hypothetical protein [Paenibacillus sp. NFR01]|uniref:hypothetical protein n=1 Tax=Paenibacillus sp. NFR01 TaxID=1566279 RepID=UPI0008BE13B9|nr:hypothetical protein [Paenibacillus sp. NFR01]SEU32429.1 hypothetical protein SAMN03159358_0122 [Paenibacillus sp. NFR01]
MAYSLLSKEFIGVLIGAAASISGGIFAARYQIKRIKESEAAKQELKVKISARIIYSDIHTLLKALLFYRKNDHKIVGFYFDFSADYSKHVDLLYERLSGDEIFLIRRIYGHLVNLQEATRTATLNSTEINLLASPIYEAAYKLIYRDSETFERQTQAFWDSITESNYNQLKNGMDKKIENLVDQLEVLKS